MEEALDRYGQWREEDPWADELRERVPVDNVDAPGLDTWQEQERVGGGIVFVWEKVNRLSKPSLTPSSSAVEPYPTWLKCSTALSILV